MIFSADEAIRELPGTIEAMKISAAATRSASFFLSAPMIVPRIALGKWRLSLDNNVRHIITDEGIIVLPTSTQTKYFSDITQMMRPGNTLLRVPEWVGRHVKKMTTRVKVSAATTEYIQSPEHLSTLPGKRLRNMRGYARRAAEIVEVNTDAGVHPGNIAELHDLNDAWYRDANKRMFRTYEKKNIDWCLDNWSTLVEIDPTVKLCETRHREGGMLELFQIGAQLCPGFSTGYCERYRRDGVTSANYYAFGLFSLALGEPQVNDGTADSPNIRALKEKLSLSTIKTFNIEVLRK